MTGCLGSKKWIEDARSNILRNARSVIDDLNDNVMILFISFDPDLTSAIHRVHGVINDIRPDLVELAGIRFDARQVW